MASQTSNKDTSYDISNKRYATDNEITEAKPLNFYDADRYAFVSIDPVIVGKLKLTREDLFEQEIVGENILLRRRKETI
ncbi:MAG: hypothetical protein ACRD8W_23605 [Nitrososphaeraceae archaeon]